MQNVIKRLYLETSPWMKLNHTMAKTYLSQLQKKEFNTERR